MRIGGLITYISNRNGAFVNTKLKSANITYGEAKVINYLHYQGCVSQDQLTKFLLIDKSAVTRILKHMEDKKLILKTVSNQDKRSYDLYLTKKGEQLFEIVDDVFAQTSSLMVQDLSEKEKEILMDLLNRVKKNMEG